MSLINIIATIACDECGDGFSVYLDPATELYDNCLFDIAENEVRGGNSLVSDENPLGSTSVQDDKMLCVSCTKKFDKEDPTS